MYSKIYDFCKIRNVGGVYKNDADEPTPRVKYLMSLLDSEGISYELDKSLSNKTTIYNLILKGTSDKMVVAHHDIVNPEIDNANDNSASVINAIMIKKLMPSMNVCLLDGEEVGGLGSQRISELINDGYFGGIDWVLNLELTGKGGKNFFIGDYPGKLYDHIKSIFDCPTVSTPFNDAVIFRKNGIDSVVINPLPPLTEGTSNVKYGDNYLEFSLLFNCHSNRDTVSTIDPKDMQEFIEDIVLKILK
jgi:hypothetical protein